MSDETVNLQIDVGVLKNQVTTLSAICQKMDLVIDKIMSQQDHCYSQIYQDMETRRLEKNEELKTIFAEALLLVMSGEKFSEQTTMDEYLDAVLKAKEDNKTEL